MAEHQYTEPVVLSLSCIYADEEYWDDKYIQALRLGWSKIDLLRQLASPFCGAHRDYYRMCAAQDAIVRGYSNADPDIHPMNGQYYLDCALWNPLRDFEYLQMPWPEFKEDSYSPLANIAMPTISKGTRRSFSRYKSSLLNSAILNIACRVEGLTLSHLLSKVLVWHFDKYWKSSYTRQLSSADALSWEDPPEGYLYIPNLEK